MDSQMEQWSLIVCVMWPIGTYLLLTLITCANARIEADYKIK